MMFSQDNTGAGTSVAPVDIISLIIECLLRESDYEAARKARHTRTKQTLRKQKERVDIKDREVLAPVPRYALTDLFNAPAVIRVITGVTVIR